MSSMSDECLKLAWLAMSTCTECAIAQHHDCYHFIYDLLFYFHSWWYYHCAQVIQMVQIARVAKLMYLSQMVEEISSSSANSAIRISSASHWNIAGSLNNVINAKITNNRNCACHKNIKNNEKDVNDSSDVKLCK